MQTRTEQWSGIARTAGCRRREIENLRRQRVRCGHPSVLSVSQMRAKSYRTEIFVEEAVERAGEEADREVGWNESEWWECGFYEGDHQDE